MNATYTDRTNGEHESGILDLGVIANVGQCRVGSWLQIYFLSCKHQCYVNSVHMASGKQWEYAKIKVYLHTSLGIWLQSTHKEFAFHIRKSIGNIQLINFGISHMFHTGNIQL